MGNIFITKNSNSDGKVTTNSYKNIDLHSCDSLIWAFEKMTNEEKDRLRKNRYDKIQKYGNGKQRYCVRLTSDREFILENIHLRTGPYNIYPSPENFTCKLCGGECYDMESSGPNFYGTTYWENGERKTKNKINNGFTIYWGHIRHEPGCMTRVNDYLKLEHGNRDKYSHDEIIKRY